MDGAHQLGIGGEEREERVDDEQGESFAPGEWIQRRGGEYRLSLDSRRHCVHTRAAS